MDGKQHTLNYDNQHTADLGQGTYQEIKLRSS